MSIPPIPQPEGYEVEYMGVCLNPKKITKEVLILEGDLWIKLDGNWDGDLIINRHWCNLLKITLPTTLAQLVGEDGQKNVWIIFDDNHQKAQALVCAGKYDSFYFFFAGESKSIETLKKCGARWSNDPFTTWENANEFIPA